MRRQFQYRKKKGNKVAQKVEVVNENQVGIPGPYFAQQTLYVTRRFNLASDLSSPSSLILSNIGFLSAVGWTGTGTTTYKYLATSVKLKRVRLWVSPVYNANAMDCSLSWQWDSQMGPEKIIVITGTANNPGHFEMKPPALSTAAFWFNGSMAIQTSGSGFPGAVWARMNITAQTNVMVEVDLSFTIDNGNNVIQSGGTAATGGFCVPQLDGVQYQFTTRTVGVLDPVGFNVAAL